MDTYYPAYSTVFLFYVDEWWGSEAESFSQAISDADSMFAIMLATLIAFFVALVMYIVQRIATGRANGLFLNGAKMMVYATLILVAAWSIKEV